MKFIFAIFVFVFQVNESAFASTFQTDANSVIAEKALTKVTGNLLAGAYNTFFTRSFYGKVNASDLPTREVYFRPFQWRLIEEWDESFDYENPKLLSEILSTNPHLAFNHRFELQFIEYSGSKKFLALVINYVQPDTVKKNPVMLFLLDIPSSTKKAKILNVKDSRGFFDPWNWSIELSLNDTPDSYEMRYSLKFPVYVEFGDLLKESSNVFMARQ